MQQVFFTFGFLWFLVLLRVVRGPGARFLGCGKIERTSSSPSGQTGRTTKQWPYCVRIIQVTILPLFNILTKWTPPPSSMRLSPQPFTRWRGSWMLSVPRSLVRRHRPSPRLSSTARCWRHYQNFRESLSLSRRPLLLSVKQDLQQEF